MPKADSGNNALLPDSIAPRTIKRRITITPQFHQTDMMGVVHNAQYFIWFEQGRLQIMLDVMSFEEAIEKGFMFPVVENRCKYRHPVRFGDTLILTTSHRIMTNYMGSLRFAHSLINDKTKTEVASGETSITIIRADSGTLVKDWPQDVWLRYQNLK